MNRQIEIYDLETLLGCFTYTGYNIDTKEITQFVIMEGRNDYDKLIKHLRTLVYQVGFNNVNFDYPILHNLMLNYGKFKEFSGQRLCGDIHDFAQELINNQERPSFIKLKDYFIPQLDLFKIWHFNNKARRTSLKALEIAMNFPNVKEMPINHNTAVLTDDQVKQVLDYNLNDVMATKAFYELSLAKIQLRKDIRAKYGLECQNFSDSRIGESLVLDLYCKKIGANKWDVKELRTHRANIALKDCIFSYIEFKSKEFNDLLTKLNNKTITQTKGAIKDSVVFHGFKYDYGAGGIHGCIKAGVYEANEDYVIIDADVASLYPSIAVLNNLYPEHLGPEFIDVYSDILNQRITAKNAGQMSISDALKLSLNSVYGKSNEATSFLYDPMYTMKTTINGQLMLTMLAEELVLGIPGMIVLQINTDGITVMVPNNQRSINAYYNICDNWEILTKLTLEYVEYSKMIIRDVNNYIAVSTKGKIKYKGAFEINKDLHKDNSFKVIPIALSEYFVKGIPVETTIKNHKNIYDFCGRQKFDSKSKGQISYAVKDDVGNYIEVTETTNKNTRYYVSNKGNIFTKVYRSGEKEAINKGYLVTLFDNYEHKDWDSYDINYQFYIKEANKEIDSIIDKQLTLF
jgi:DNA polymerase elongation subunit (family B)